MRREKFDEGDGYKPYIYVDATRLGRGKCYDLILIGLLRPPTLGSEKEEDYVTSQIGNSRTNTLVH